ncbi:MAG: tyrosine--tRNA ligase [Candidatus Omnitrophica bacterium]|nr:tyrosine--tRNA ligase [Candidatus Omnitrophota bacterium]MBU1128153.1 tyrosine--tRNA ligase [Candidatus Omnitrophota bacterium]MBU1783994.1 tyrosine--tRNA ligase [Candidatus Omnitrophota bacterium]MBU1851488.1 tyrosine--tRNA ligase [Candidatus Omnitrophota bacterium]
MKSVKEQIDIIKRGTDEIISIPELEEKLALDRPLVVKAGFDPSAPDIHLGHTVLLRKMKHFQDLGHDVHFLIGDFTGRIGDPSGRSKVRKQLSIEAVIENAKTYKKQIFKILDKSRTKVEFNSSWCSKLGVEGIFDLASRYTVARMLERDDFCDRYHNEEPISIIEFLYPLLQAYDSVVMQADVELGGTDQKFNLLVGRDMQRSYMVPPPPQVIITMPILEGLRGADKMSKSLNNYVGVSEPPEEMFGKLMSISDDMMWKYYELLTDIEYQPLKQKVDNGEAHPKEVKAELAKMIVSEYHSEKAAEKARMSFESVFARKELPEDIQKFTFDLDEISIADLVKKVGFADSTSAARRLVKQNAVSISGKKVRDANFMIRLDADAKILRVGKRKFAKISRT